MISKQIFSFILMFLCSLIEELCTKEESDKTDCNFNFGHECNFLRALLFGVLPAPLKTIFPTVLT